VPRLRRREFRRDLTSIVMAKKKDDGTKVIADNRKARYAFAIDTTLEAGLMLTGSEVKSLRTGKATIGESYAFAKDGELFLVNSYIPEYTQASRFNHEPKRTRKLLVHKKESTSPGSTYRVPSR
jgi:SsrA-binding protein